MILSGNTRRIASTLIAAVVLCACRKPPKGGPDAAGSRSFVRGDAIVVEKTAAQFFEARVLAVAAATLKVQTSTDGEPMTVAVDDAYRVPGPAATFGENDPGICRRADSEWLACRILRTEGATVRVLLPDGQELALQRGAVLAPSPVTAINIRQYFQRVELRQTFMETARHAGAPPRRHGWLPEAREPVIAKRGLDWYSAHVEAALEDGVKIRWDGGENPEDLARDAVAQVPPFDFRGIKPSFALTRPPSAAEPWVYVRIEATGADQAVVILADGTRRRIDLRDLVPLLPSP